ncbi:unnamed protein product [[Candida] boidinii]|uniref:Nucleolar GTP-binding protein 2 n=1 Tax=Candida boidinii TaxID=5477 RepID=A0A9W6T032_CANBO|nr:unnamed protein product [[Candida] boidinii]GME90689.1 unnamed protein product [[Candida] boidinii]GMF51462.1 unnamed protein product [[Candida] boidinii]GMF99288.1 unnamed protein product [[Candida] boidinii]
MATGKTEKARRHRQNDLRDGNLRVKGENFYRDAKKVKHLNMYKTGKAVRNAKGEIIKAAFLQDTKVPTARVDPNKRWFGNTRVISQDALTHFRDAMGDKKHDSYSVLMKRNKLPMSLLDEKDNLESPQSKFLETETYEHTFGPKSQRKKPNVSVSSLSELVDLTNSDQKQYEEKEELKSTLGLMGGLETDEWTAEAKEHIFSKGQSKRIWNELYKVIDSSDVIIHAAWVKHLSKDFPTLAFHASITNSFGKGSLIQLLRQFSVLHQDRKQISVGFIGYPNTGKSSIINTLRRKKVCQVAPIPGETKVWQYITLMKRIFLIDCPGIVPPSTKDTESDILFRGVVRVEHVSHPEQFIPDLLEKCERKHLERTYEISGWKNSEEFIELIARKQGRLLKGGEPDETGVAKQVITDFNRGKIPWFVPPPEDKEIREGDDKKAHYKRKRAEREAAKLNEEQEDYNNENEEELLDGEEVSEEAAKAEKESAEEEDEENEEERPSKKQKN